jgi:hypothetical protein
MSFYSDTVFAGTKLGSVHCSMRVHPKVIMKYSLTTINTRFEATQRVVVAKLTRLTHK